MPTDKASYLAAHYLTTETKSTKKRKLKHKSSTPSSGLLITDDDDSGWAASSRRDDDEDPDAPLVVSNSRSAEFRRANNSAWKTVGVEIPTDTKDARDAEATARPADEAPVVVGGDAMDVDDDGDGGVPMMSDGTKAGLQSAAAITAQLERRRRQEQKELTKLNAERAAAGADDGEGELVLRDATGRRVDVSMKRADARRAAAAAEDQARRDEEAKKRALKGEVQLEQSRRRREALEDAALMPLARTKDDEALNAELKGEERWNDPMAQFMGDDTRSGGAKKKGSKIKRPLYKGAAPPNRYGIKPGYRWDGVDRGIGFEAERFKALNRRERDKNLAYSWQEDV
jgi:pre-mRNA-splicing factor CWC26